MMQRKPKYVEYVTNSGVTVWVTPLSRTVYSGILQKARDTYPFPNAADYEEQHPDALPGIEVPIPAESNMEYLELKAEAAQEQQDHIWKAINDLCLAYPKYKNGKPLKDQFYTQDELIEEFKSTLLEMKLYAEVPEDEWQATYECCILGGEDDEKNIALIVQDKLPITGEEIDQEIRLFRPVLSRNALALLARKQSASSVEGKQYSKSKT